EASGAHAGSGWRKVRSLPARFGEGRPGRKACLAYEAALAVLGWQLDRIIPSTRHEPAIDVVGLAGDVAGARRGQEHRHRGDVVRRVGTTDRDAGFLLGEKLLDRDAALGRARDRVTGAELGPRDARADGIDVDVEPAELLR